MVLLCVVYQINHKDFVHLLLYVLFTCLRTKQREGKDNWSQLWAEVTKWHRHFEGCSRLGICAHPVLISTDFAKIWQAIRKKAFLYGAGFYLMSKFARSWATSSQSQGRFFGKRDPFDLRKLHSDLRNKLIFIVLVSQYRFYTWHMFKSKISTTILVF